MRHLLAIAAIAAAFAYLPELQAQPRAGRRTVPGRGRGRTNTTPPPQAKKPNPVDMCQSRRAVLDSEDQRFQDDLALLAGINAEVTQLKQRIKELEAQRNGINASVNRERARLRDKRRSYERECKSNENCGQYEKLAIDLERQNKPVDDYINRVRDELTRSQRDISDLGRRIEPLRREYASLQCNNLIPGETAQSTIDRCSNIFSDWNRLQSDLNRHNTRLPALRSRYQQLLAQADQIERKAKDYETYLARNCKASPQLTVVRKYRGVKDRAEKLHRELDNLANEVTRLRGIRITVEPGGGRR